MARKKNTTVRTRAKTTNVRVRRNSKSITVTIDHPRKSGKKATRKRVKRKANGEFKAAPKKTRAKRTKKSGAQEVLLAI